MKVFLWHTLLTLFWAAISDNISLLNLVVGFFVAYFVLFFARRAIGHTNYFHKVIRTIQFLLFLVLQIIQSTLRISRDVLSPRLRVKPGVIAISLDAKTNTEIATFANLLSLTPGSISLDVSSKKDTLLIHTMYLDPHDRDKTRNEIKTTLEKKILELIR